MKLSPAFLTVVSFASAAAAAHSEQLVFDPLTSSAASADYAALDVEIESLLAIHHDDPIAAMKAYDPSSAVELAQPRLLEVFGTGKAVWMTEGDKLRLKTEGRHFIDVTEFRDVRRKDGFTETTTKWPEEITQREKVEMVTQLLSLDNLKSTIATLTSFWNRHYKSEHGRESSHWVFNQVLDVIKNAPSSPALSVEKFTHAFPQSSIIARFEPATGRNTSAPVFIVGAHQDSANYRFPMLRAPGADDDGSGTVAILEVFRTLAWTGFQPKYPVEFHWYAGEEGGLLGSQDVVKDYVAKGVNVGAMIQLDMIAYVTEGLTPTFTMISTDVDNALTNYTVKLAEAYINEPVQQAKLFPNAGSDHMSWYRAGFPAVFATEGDPMAGAFDPNVHTPNDRHDIEGYSLEHALEAAKVAVAFVVELAGWEGDVPIPRLPRPPRPESAQT